MSEPWALARPDWRERIKGGLSLLPELPELNTKEAKRAIGVFNKLRLPDVIGQPPLREAGGEWFREIVGAVLGSVDVKTGRRMIRELFLLAPKKSSKTSYGAAFMLTALLLNERPRAEYLLIAPTISVANVAMKQVVGMIEADAFLKKRMHVQDHLRTITDRRTKATLVIKAFDASVLTGVKPVGVLFDELHEAAKNSAAARIIRQIRGGIIPNPEGFLAFITTQSDGPPRGAFLAELRHARAIRDGTAKGSTLPILYEFPEDIANDQAIPPAWQDPATWWMVTPNRDLSITIDRLIEDFEKARDEGDSEVLGWASQHLNLEVGLALGSGRWAGAEHWLAATERLTLDEIIERSEVLTIGGDGGGLDDLLGLAVMGREKRTRRLLLWCKAWAHPSVLERRKGEASVLRDFEKVGDLRIIERLGEDIEELAAIAKRVKASGKLFKVGLDPAGVGGIVDGLEQAGIKGDSVVGISQGWRLSGAIKTMERALADGTMAHCGQPMMNWCVGNAKVEPRGNAIIITKQAAGSAKIDPLMASFNAITLMGMNPAPQGSAMLTLLD